MSGTSVGISSWKTGIVAFLLLFLVVFIIQNITPFQMRFLFFQFSVPGAVLILVAFLVGLTVAIISTARKARSKG
jgi:uncharacterized integral membrane protein